MQDADVKAERLAVEDYVTLRATAPWVDAPQSLLLPHNGRTFEIRVGMLGHCAGVGGGPRLHHAWQPRVRAA